MISSTIQRIGGTPGGRLEDLERGRAHRQEVEVSAEQVIRAPPQVIGQILARDVLAEIQRDSSLVLVCPPKDLQSTLVPLAVAGVHVTPVNEALRLNEFALEFLGESIRVYDRAGSLDQERGDQGVLRTRIALTEVVFIRLASFKIFLELPRQRGAYLAGGKISPGLRERRESVLPALRGDDLTLIARQVSEPLPAGVVEDLSCEEGDLAPVDKPDAQLVRRLPEPLSPRHEPLSAAATELWQELLKQEFTGLAALFNQNGTGLERAFKKLDHEPEAKQLGFPRAATAEDQDV